MAAIATSNQQAPLAGIDIEAAIDEIASGTLTRTIAARYGIPKPTLRDRLVKHPRYASAIAEQAESLVEKATAEMMDDELEADASVIARARARVDTAFKWAAARDAANWGAKQTVTLNHGVTVESALGDLAHALLDKMRVIEGSGDETVVGNVVTREQPE